MVGCPRLFSPLLVEEVRSEPLFVSEDCKACEREFGTVTGNTALDCTREIGGLLLAPAVI